MVDRELLQDSLLRVDQAAFALSCHATESEPELQVALALLGDVRRLLTTAAFHRAAPPPATVPRARDDGDDLPALVRQVRLDGDLRAASAARAFTTATCRLWALPAAATSTVVDLASELVSNAVRHAGGPVEVVLERRGEHVLVTVADGSGEPPQLLPYRRGVSEQGIGLRLVDQLSQSWGWNAVPEGKQVWARAAVSGGQTPVRPARRLASSPGRPTSGTG